MILPTRSIAASLPDGGAWVVTESESRPAERSRALAPLTTTPAGGQKRQGHGDRRPARAATLLDRARTTAASGNRARVGSPVGHRAVERLRWRVGSQIAAESIHRVDRLRVRVGDGAIEGRP